MRNWLVLVLSAALIGCGGGGPGKPNPPPPPPPGPSVSITAPAPNTQVSGTATIAASVKNASVSASVQFRLDGANVGSPASVANGVASAEWDSQTAIDGTHMLSATLTDGSASSSAIMVMVNNTPTPPVLTFSGPDTVTVNPGASQQFSFTLTGNPAPTVNCDATIGTIVNTGVNSVTYRAPTPQSNVSDTLTCAADNNVNPIGVDSVTITVPVTPNGPVITSIEPETVYFRDQSILGATLRGGNFTSGQTLAVDHGQVFNAFVVSPTQLNFNWSGTLDFFDPGDIEVTLTGQSGSVTTNFLFKGNFDTMACSTTECFQVATIPGVIAVYNKNTGARVRVIDPIAGRTNVAWDNSSGLLAFAYLLPFSIQVRTIDGEFTTPSGDPLSIPEPQTGAVTEVDSTDGYACSPRDQDDRLVFFDMTATGETPLGVSQLIGNQPTPVAMATLGAQLVCATFSVEDLKYSILRIPQNTILGQSTLNGLRKASQLAAAQGGWRLKLFSSGSASGTAALLHDEDKTVVFLNASTGAELRRVTLTGLPFRMEADEANGQVIVANWDSEALKTRFNKVKVSTGQVSSLSGTVNFAATGMEICGPFVCVANRDNAFAKVPLN